MAQFSASPNNLLSHLLLPFPRTLYRDGGIPRFYRGLLPALAQGPISRDERTEFQTNSTFTCSFYMCIFAVHEKCILDFMTVFCLEQHLIVLVSFYETFSFLPKFASKTCPNIF